MRALSFIAMVGLASAGCSVLIPLDEFLTDGTGGDGAGGATSSTTGSTTSTSSGGGGADPGCTPERETDPNNCGEVGYECEEGICDACLCAPHSMGDFLIGATLLDFGFGRKTDSTEVAVASLVSDTTGAIDVLSVGPDSWSISDDYLLAQRVSERIIADQGRYFYATDGIYSRNYDLTPGDPSTSICQWNNRPAEDTFDHLARGGSHIYRSAYPAGGSAGRIDQCLTDFPGPPAVFIDPSTSNAWEVVASSTGLVWTNRVLGGGVHRKPASNFDVTAPETLYSVADGVPTGVGLVDGQVFFADCRRRELLEVPPTGAPSKIVDTLGHAVLLEAFEEDNGTVTIYTLEAASPDECSAPVPIVQDGSLVRYREGASRVLARGIRIPTALHAHDGFIYFTQQRAGMPAPPPEVMRLPL